MDQMQPRCARSACQEPLDTYCWQIHNQGQNPPRRYCIPCGRKIVDFNRSRPDDLQLKADIVNTETGHPLEGQHADLSTSQTRR